MTGGPTLDCFSPPSSPLALFSSSTSGGDVIISLGSFCFLAFSLGFSVRVAAVLEVVGVVVVAVVDVAFGGAGKVVTVEGVVLIVFPCSFVPLVLPTPALVC